MHVKNAICMYSECAVTVSTGIRYKVSHFTFFAVDKTNMRNTFFTAVQNGIMFSSSLK